MDSIKYQQITNLKLTACARDLIMGHIWIFQQDSDPKTNIKITKHQTSAMATPVPTPEHNMDLGIWRDSVWRNGF